MKPTANKAIQKQAHLPLIKCLKMAWQSIRLRPGRSLLVVSGIVLAIAFLTNILCSEALSVNASRVMDAPSAAAVTATASDDPADAEGGSSFEARWMATLALMIAFIGILNAMLLSVTERFHEIGTMKCLGALDSLIIKLFLLESLFQGIAGTLVGITLGILLTMVEGWFAYGAAATSLVPVGQFVSMSLICLLIGIGLTIAGALYPAWRAARMAPVAALRSEV